MGKAHSVKPPVSKTGNSEQALAKTQFQLIFMFDKVTTKLSYFKNNISA